MTQTLQIQNKIRLPESVWGLIRCPICEASLRMSADQSLCTNSECAKCYPIVNGAPVLINEKKSVFSIDDFVSQRNTTFNLKKSKFRVFLRWLVPEISQNWKAKENYKKFSRLLLSKSKAPRVLVIGGSIPGQGMQSLTSSASIELIETDVSFGPLTQLICDSHDLPFCDGSFDGVVIQAVLEHVVDPYRCVAEVHRVLKPHGIVFAETAFMQQVHLGRYDFMRFTHLGHRRLFRQFVEIDSGVACGPGVTLAWSYQYFLLSFVSSKAARDIIKAFTSFTAFFLKYIDYFLVNSPGSLDAASGYYFLGTKSDHILSDKELVNLYKGAM